MRRAGLIAVAVTAAALGVTAAEAGSQARALLVGLTATKIERVDPLTLQPAGRAVAIPFPWGATALSPDRTSLAVASNNFGRLRIVDVRRMRVLSELALVTAPGDLFWLSKRLLVAHVSTDVASRLVAIDPTTRRVRWRVTLGSGPAEIHPYGTSLVILLAPPDHIGAPQLIEVGPRGTVRHVLLHGILAGTNWPDDPSTEIADSRWPGLAVDLRSGHAYVVGANEPIADVDLTNLGVTYHAGSRVLSKALRGPWRAAVSIDGGLLAVTGYDSSASIDANGQETATMTPAGLQLVDTATWTRRWLDPGVSSVVPGGDVLLATGLTVISGNGSGSGLSIYGIDGSLHAHLFGSDAVLQVTALNGLAYAWAGGPGRVAVVDPASGNLLAMRPTRLLELVN